MYKDIDYNREMVTVTSINIAFMKFIAPGSLNIKFLR